MKRTLTCTVLAVLFGLQASLAMAKAVSTPESWEYLQPDRDQVIVTLPWMSHRKIIRIVRQCQRRQTKVRIIPDLFQMSLSKVVMENLDGIPLIGITEPALHSWQVLLKRVMDVGISALGLLILSPLLGLVALAIKIDSTGPIIFKQTRVGRGGRKFTCYKFRSMEINAESELDALREKIVDWATGIFSAQGNEHDYVKGIQDLFESRGASTAYWSWDANDTYGVVTSADEAGYMLGAFQRPYLHRIPAADLSIQSLEDGMTASFTAALGDQVVAVVPEPCGSGVTVQGAQVVAQEGVLWTLDPESSGAVEVGVWGCGGR